MMEYNSADRKNIKTKENNLMAKQECDEFTCQEMMETYCFNIFLTNFVAFHKNNKARNLGFCMIL